MITLHLGDSAEVLRGLPDNSADALVTDPPSGIAFMGKSWDTDKGGRDQWIAWLRDILIECRRVLKPGAHALIWALPRTSHWTATAVEDAGFQVRDVICHVFGNGFPKSLDVSKAIDKAAGAEREDLGRHPNWREGKRTNGQSMGAVPNEARITAPATDAACQWNGWGTALKPAAEHWILARVPLAGTVAANVLEHGTGGINVDACRVGTAVETWPASRSYDPRKMAKPHADAGFDQHQTQSTGDAPAGRWPPHLLMTHSAECGARCVAGCPVRMMDEQSGESKSPPAGHTISTRAHAGFDGAFGMRARPDAMNGHGDSGGASRFFPRFRYQAKPSSAEKSAGLDGFRTLSGAEVTGREEGSAGSQNPRSGRTASGRNAHPTVKPIGLMRWLVRLITPPGGVVLDPFMGSGTTGIGAVSEGASFVGIERESEYYAIARARIEHASSGRVEEPSADVPGRPAKDQGDLFAGF